MHLRRVPTKPPLFRSFLTKLSLPAVPSYPISNLLLPFKGLFKKHKSTVYMEAIVDGVPEILGIEERLLPMMTGKLLDEPKTR